jgi:hypothetical protein|tara:strand:+ start:2137 stop:2595 length:459 start_codon:yes stop_codon:yes gene_type:complete
MAKRKQISVASARNRTQKDTESYPKRYGTVSEPTQKSNQMKNYFDNIKRYRAFSVKYRPATNFKSSRITIYDKRLGERVTIPYDHRYDSPWEIAVTYLLNLPHPIQIESLGMSNDDSHVLLSTDFSTSIKQAEKKQAKNRIVSAPTQNTIEQ